MTQIVSDHSSPDMYRMKTFFRKFPINKANMNVSRNECKKLKIVNFNNYDLTFKLYIVNDSFTNKQIPIEFATLDNIRPSPSFLTVNRDLQKQPIYIDQYDGPSSLITISPDRKTDLTKSYKMKNPYQEERNQFLKSYVDFNASTIKDSGSCTFPALKRKKHESFFN